jgi:GT2 family glycosyltransferase
MDISIIIPCHNPDPKILEKIKKSLKSQDFKGKKELMILKEKGGLSEKYNKGIKKAKYPFVLTLHQDCVPSTKNWLSNLSHPMKDSNVVASVSSVHLPEKLWDSFDLFARALTASERGKINPLLDGKGCLYRKSSLEKVGLFDETHFKTAGEDFDIYIKLSKIGKIKYPDATVMHFHPTNFLNRLKKTFQYANAFGTLSRAHKRKMPGIFKGFLMALPILGIPFFFLKFPITKYPMLFIPKVITSIPENLYYSIGFWKGFLSKSQTVEYAKSTN